MTDCHRKTQEAARLLTRAIVLMHEVDPAIRERLAKLAS